MPQRASRAQDFVRFSPGPSFSVASLDCGPPPDAKTFSCGWSGSRRRVLMKRGGGFVPSEVRYPGPLSQLLCTGCSLGRERHRTASRSPAAVERKRRTGLRSSHSLGLHASFPGERSWAPSANDRATRVPAGDERSGPGLGYLVRHEADPCVSGLFAAAPLNQEQDVFACVGGPQTSDATQNEGPGGSELITCRDARRSTIHYRAPSPFARKWGVSPFTWRQHPSRC